MAQGQQPITHAQIEKAAQELARTEDGKPAPVQATIKGVELCGQVRGEYKPAVDSAKQGLQAAKSNATKKSINEAYNEQRDSIDARYQQAIDEISAEIHDIGQLISTQQSNFTATKQDLKDVRRDNRNLRKDAEKHKQSLEKALRNYDRVAQSRQERGKDVSSFNDSIAYFAQRIADVKAELDQINKPENDLEELLEAIEKDMCELQEQFENMGEKKQNTLADWDQDLYDLRERIRQTRNEAVKQARGKLTIARDERNAAKAIARQAVTASVSREFAASGMSAAYRIGSGAETAARTTYGVGLGVAMIPVVVVSSAAEQFQKETYGQKSRQNLEQQRQQQLPATGGPQ